MDKEIVYGRTATLLRSVDKASAKRCGLRGAVSSVALASVLIAVPNYTVAKVGEPPAVKKKALSGPIPVTGHKYALSPGPECGSARFVIEVKGNWVTVESASGSLPRELEPHGRMVSSDRGIEISLGTQPCRLDIVISGTARESPQGGEKPQ